MPEQTSPRPSRAPGPGDPGFDPIEAAPREQGGSVWAVALAVSDEGPNDPKLAVHPAENFSPAILDVDCDRGSRTGLHLRPEKEYWYAVIYFYSQETAFKFKELYDLKVVGVVKDEPIKDCR
ncbi:MAG TPA: hypothetical protein VGR21_02135 [Cryptosporangiaceae bacterium]|nr:hypothetical protein [Cryptosporangiaceae bacterium]